MFLLSQLLQLYLQRISTSILLGVFVIVCYFFSTNICVDFEGSNWSILRRDSATAWEYTRDTTLYKMFKASNHNKTEEKKQFIYKNAERLAGQAWLGLLLCNGEGGRGIKRVVMMKERRV